MPFEIVRNDITNLIRAHWVVWDNRELKEAERELFSRSASSDFTGTRKKKKLLIRHKRYIMRVKLETKKEQIHHGKIFEHD